MKAKTEEQMAQTKAAIAALAQWLRKGIIDGVDSDIVKRRICLFPKKVAQDP